MRRDVLAAGARTAQFAGGFGETDLSRNLYKGEDTDAPLPVLETVKAPRKRFRPLGKTILVRRAEAKTSSGIYIPDSAEKDKPAEGEVLATGHDAYAVQVGQQIAFGRYAGAEFPLNGETLLLMSITEVLGVIEDEFDEEATEVAEVEQTFDIPANVPVGVA